MKKLRIFLTLALLFTLGAGCFNGSGVNSEPINASKITQAEVEAYKAIMEQVPEGIAYLRLSPGATALVTRSGEQVVAKTGFALYAGDKVETDLADVELIFPGTGISRLSPGTSITLLPDGKIQNNQNIGAFIILETGKILNRFERVFRMGEKFTVQVDNVVATVRGTAFAVEKDSSNVDIQVAESTIKLATLDAIDYMDEMGNIPADMGWPMSAGDGIALNMQSFQALAKIEPLPEGSYAYFDTNLYFDGLFTDKMQPINPDAMRQDAAMQWMKQSLSPEQMQVPSNAYYWYKPPTMDPTLTNYIDPEAVQTWQNNFTWLMENQQELEEAESMRDEMEAAGMFASPSGSEPSTANPDGSPSASGPMEDAPPPELIYYDENGQPHFTDEALGTDSGSNSIELLGETPDGF